MFRKMLTSNVAMTALAAGFATALAAPAGAVVCTPEITEAVNYEDVITCTIDFSDTNDDGVSQAPNVELLFTSDFHRRNHGQDTGSYVYNVFGAPVTGQNGFSPSVASADLIVMTDGDNKNLEAEGSVNGFGVSTFGVSDPVDALLNDGERIEFAFQTPTEGSTGFDPALPLITLDTIRITSYRVGESFAIEAFDAGDQSTGIVNLVTTAGLAADDQTAAAESDGAVASYEVGLAGVRFQIIGAQEAVPESAGGPDGAAGNGLYGVRVRGATFTSGVIPLPGALIPALTGLAALGGFGGLAARRRRQKAA